MVRFGPIRVRVHVGCLWRTQTHHQGMSQKLFTAPEQWSLRLLKIRDKAAARMRKVAKKILDALQLIPSILSGARRVLNIFRDHEALEDKSKGLYLSILAAMGHMLEYLKRRSDRKVIEAVFKQQSFEADLLTKIEDITKVRDAFNDESELCHKEVLQKMAEDSTRNRDEMAILVEVLSVSSSEQQRSHQAIVECLQSFDHSLMSLVQGVGEMKKEVTSITRTVKPMAQFLEMLRANPIVWEHVAQMSVCPLLRLLLTLVWLKLHTDKPLDAPSKAEDNIIIRRNSIMDVVKGRSRSKYLTSNYR